MLQFCTWRTHVQDSFMQQVTSSHAYLSQYSFHIFHIFIFLVVDFSQKTGKMYLPQPNLFGWKTRFSKTIFISKNGDR